jgi:hypothetical protein
MKLTTATLRKIIKEECEKVLTEQNFDGQTGLPLNPQAMKSFRTNKPERFKSEIFPVINKLISKIRQDYGQGVRQLLVFAINNAANQDGVFMDLFKLAQEKGIATAQAQAQPDGDKIASDALASAKSSVMNNLSPEAKQNVIKRFDELIKQAEEAGNQEKADKLRKKKEFYN